MSEGQLFDFDYIWTRIDYESAQVLEYMAQVLVSHEPIEGEFVVLESEEPVMNYPNDQGDVDVWLDNGCCPTKHY